MDKEQKLTELISKYEDLKDELEALIDEYDADYADDKTMNLFLEASNAADDVIDSLNDILDE